jgi:hypothetical protein
MRSTRTALLAAAIAALVIFTGGTASSYTISGPLSVSDTTVVPGQQVTVSGSGYEPGATVEVTLTSTPVLLTTTTADGGGAISATVTIPLGTDPGAHTLSATGAAPEGDTLVLSAEITVEGGSVGAIAFTGTDAFSLGVIAVAAVAVGSLLVFATRRRPLAPIGQRTRQTG